MNEIDLKFTFEEIETMKIKKYQNIVETQIKMAAFGYLKGKIKSKGKEINYGEQLVCQNYLLPNQVLTFSEQKLLFAYQSRTNKLKYNYPTNEELEICQCGLEITNEHLYYCSELNQRNSEQDSYERIFDGTFVEQKQILKILETNMTKHIKFTSAQE